MCIIEIHPSKEGYEWLKFIKKNLIKTLQQFKPNTFNEYEILKNGHSCSYKSRYKDKIK